MTDTEWRTQIRNILTDVIERRGVGEPEHYISDDDEQLHELLALLLTVQEQTAQRLRERFKDEIAKIHPEEMTAGVVMRAFDAALTPKESKDE